MKNIIGSNFEKKEIISSYPKLNEYLDYIFLETSFNGVLFGLINPIKTIIDNEEINTGFLKSLPIELVLKQTKDIDWEFLYNNIKFVSNKDFKLVIKILYNKTFIDKNKILDEKGNVSVIHLNTPLRLPDDNDIQINSSKLPSYGLNGIYSSTFNLLVIVYSK